MSEINDEQTDYEASEEIFSGTGLHVVTLSYSTTGAEPPDLDLGDTPPVVAAALFAQCIEAIEATMRWPRISFNGEIFMDPYLCPDCDDEDE